MIGHTAARAYLERTLPTATLLYGPASVGKWTLATHLADHYRVSATDRWQVEHGFTIDTVRLVTDYARRAPRGAFKLVQARVDEASHQALNALLKTLEEPPPRVKFMLVSSAHTLPTVASRCVVFELGMLRPGELEQIYRTQGFPASKARDAAAYARGQVKRGYQINAADQHKTQVLALVKALATHDRDLFDNVFTAGWDSRASDLLTTFITECLTQRWNAFRLDDACGLHLDRPRLMHMITALGRLPHARSRLGVRAALEPFLARR